jgi:peptidoglycan/LPS O-acetylase OafA/YrhL
MYYLAILGYFLIRLAAGLLHSHAQGVKGLDVYTPGSVFANICFVNGFVPSAQNNIVPGGWSIGAEFFFYACFPFLIRSSGLTQASVLFGIVTGIATIAHFSVHSDVAMTNNSFWYFFPLVHLPCFLAGILLFNNVNRLGRPSYLLALVISATAGMAGIAYLWPLGLGNNLLFLLVPSLSIAPFGLLLVLASKSGFGNSTALRAIGERSFSMYLNHFFFIDLFAVLVGRHGPQQSTVVLGYLAVCLCSFLAACVSYSFVELPFISIGSRISKGLASAAQA